MRALDLPFLALLATLVPAQAPAPIVTTIDVPAPRAEVWRAWTTSEGLATFFAPKARVELRPGGPFEVWFLPDAEWGQRGSEGCRVLSWIDGEMLSFSWSAPPSLGPKRATHAFVVVRLSDLDGGRATAVELVHGGFKAGFDDVRDYFAKAWPFVLGNLKKRFAEGPLFGEAAGAADPGPAQHWVYVIQPREARIATEPTPEELGAMRRHAAYVQDLVARGRVILAGPCLGETSPPHGERALPLDVPQDLGLVVFRAFDREDAQRVLDGDPAVQAGIFKARLLPLTLAFRES